MQTIHTLTLNPVIDLIYRLDAYEKGSTARSEEFKKVPAGKGFSVAYALAHLGESPVAYAPLGENDEALYQKYCDSLGVILKAVTGNFEVRQHCTILETNPPRVTHLQSTSNQIPEEIIDDVIRLLYWNLQIEDMVVISGSLPSSVKADTYADVIREAKKCGAITILDSSGEALSHGIRAHPYAVKLNQEEAEALAERKITSGQTAFGVVQAIHRMSGTPLVVVSLGEQGLVAGCEEGVWRMSIPVEPHKIVDTVGCGDSMTAGIAKGLKHDWTFEETLRYSIAVATAATFRIGPGHLNPADISALQERIQCQKIGEL